VKRKKGGACSSSASGYSTAQYVGHGKRGEDTSKRKSVYAGFDSREKKQKKE